MFEDQLLGRRKGSEFSVSGTADIVAEESIYTDGFSEAWCGASSLSE